MLLIGTSHGLRDLESGEKFVDGMAVTALAPGGADGWYALLERRFVVLLDEDKGDTVPVGELPEPDGQSMAVLPDGTVVVGRTGAWLTDPTVAELTEAAAVAVEAPGAVAGSDDEARSRLGDYFAEVLLLDQGTRAARARAELGWEPTHAGLVEEFRTGSYRK